MKIEEPENFCSINSNSRKRIGIFYFFNKYIRHYVPFMREKTQAFKKQRLFD